MRTSNVGTPIAGHNGTIFVALELSQRSWLVTMHSPDKDRFSRHKLDGGDDVGLLSLIERVRGRAAQALGAVPPVARIAHVPTPDHADARRTPRERARLITEQTAHTNRSNALLRLQGMAAGNPRRRDWVTWLKAQRDRNGNPLQPHLVGEVRREHARLILVGEQLRELGHATDAEPVSDAAAEMRRRSAVMQRLKSLGPVFTATLTNEVFYKDFHNRRQVAGYFGLAPSPWRSGGTNREQGISKAGNPRARHKAIELAWLWLRHQPESALSRWFHERTAQGKGRIKRVAIVALARKLMVALWRFLTTGLVPEGAVLKAAA